MALKENWPDTYAGVEKVFTAPPSILNRCYSGMAQSQTERDGVVAREARHYLCSTALDVESLRRGMRGHWRSRPGCTGCSMSCSMTISHACAPVIDRRTWQS